MACTPARLRKISHATLAVSASSLIALLSAPAQACPTFHTLANGTTADATQVMDNFNSVLQCPVFSGNVGIGMTPATILDITETQNAASTIRIQNGSTGGSGLARLVVGNSANAYQGELDGFGTGLTPSGMNRADGVELVGAGAGGLTLLTNAPQPMYFGTNSTEKMRLDTAGNLGIGTPSPGNKLDANIGIGNSGTIATFNAPSYDQVDIGVTSSQGYIGTRSTSPMSFHVNSAEVARFDSQGELLIGTSSDNGSYPLQVNGQIFAASSTIATSDLRRKNVLGTPGTSLLKAIFDVPTILYTRKDRPHDKLRAGYGAQNWQKVLEDNGFPDSGIVVEMNDGSLALDEGAAEALKIAALEQEIKSLRTRLRAVEKGR